MLKRIHQAVMRRIAEPLRPEPSSNSVGINAAGVWVIAVLRDGQIAVGCHGAKLPPVMLERIIMEFDRLDEKQAIGMA